jgi:CBS domain-containing protein
MQVKDIMHADVKTAAPSDTFASVASVLKENVISSVVVTDAERPVGIVTERDIVNLIADGQDPTTTQVGDRMSTNLDTVNSRTDLAEAAEHMARLRIRHLPVVEDAKLVGIISIRDLTNWAVQELTSGHELPDLERSHAALSAAAEVNRSGQ